VSRARRLVPASFDPVAFATDPVYVANRARFDADVAPVLETCNSGNCHGAPQSDFFISCGDTPEQRAFNFAQTWAFVDNPVDESQILRIPLAASAGGGPHTGGDRFPDRGGNDTDYGKLRAFAEAVGPRTFGDGDPAKEFFRDHVQPMLLRARLRLLRLPQPGAGNDFKMRPGTHGFVSSITLEKNYETLLSSSWPSRCPTRAVAARWPRSSCRPTAASRTAAGRSSAPPIRPAARRPTIRTPRRRSARCRSG
jgi:hypothetical protein